jgi:hypothetical protein
MILNHGKGGFSHDRRVMIGLPANLLKSSGLLNEILMNGFAEVVKGYAAAG